MLKRITQLITLVAGAAILLTGCYRDEIASLHKQIDALDFKSVQEQVDAIDQTVEDLQTLKNQIAPAVEALQSAKISLQSSIDSLSRVSGSNSSEISSLKSQLELINKTIAGLDVKKLDERIAYLDSVINSAKSELDQKIATLNTALAGYATLDDISGLEAQILAVYSYFDESFASYFNSLLEGAKETIIGWVSDSEEIKELFKDYYTKAEIDAKLQLIDTTNAEQGRAIAALQEGLAGVNSLITSAIAAAIEGEGGINAQISEINAQISEINTQLAQIEEILSRLDALEGIVGDTTLLTIAQNITGAINELLGYHLSDSTLIAALQGDVAALNALGLANIVDTTVSLKSLAAAIAALNDAVASKVDTSDLKDKVQGLQNAIDTLLTTSAVDAKLADYLKSADAASTYATLDSLGKFISSHIGEWQPEDGTILSRIVAIEAVIGEGFGNGRSLTDSLSALGSIVDALSADSETFTYRLDSLINALNQHDIYDVVKSLLYIPDYSDGMATLEVDKDGNVCADMVLNFKVNATESLNNTGGTLKYGVFGDVIDSIKTRSYAGESMEGTGVYDDSKGILTVTFAKEKLNTFSKLKNNGGKIAVVLTEGTASVSSDFVPVYVHSEIFTPETAADLNFPRSGGSKTIQISEGPGKNNWTVSSYPSWIVLSTKGQGPGPKDGNLTIQCLENNSGVDREGKIVIISDSGLTTREITVKQSGSSSFKVKLPENLLESNTLSYAVNNTDLYFDVESINGKEFTTENYEFKIEPKQSTITGSAESGKLKIIIPKDIKQNDKNVTLTIADKEDPSDKMTLTLKYVDPANAFYKIEGDKEVNVNMTDGVKKISKNTSVNTDIYFRFDPASSLNAKNISDDKKITNVVFDVENHKITVTTYLGNNDDASFDLYDGEIKIIPVKVSSKN